MSCTCSVPFSLIFALFFSKGFLKLGHIVYWEAEEDTGVGDIFLEYQLYSVWGEITLSFIKTHLTTLWSSI